MSAPVIELDEITKSYKITGIAVTGPSRCSCPARPSCTPISRRCAA